MTSRFPLAATLVILFGGCDPEKPKSMGHLSGPVPAGAAQSSGAVGTSTANSRPVVKLTPVAVAEIRELKPKEGNIYVRVGVKGGGVTGFWYDLKFDDQPPTAEDLVFDQDGIRIVVDRKSE